MISSPIGKYFPDYGGVYLSKYISEKNKQDTGINLILVLFAVTVIVLSLILSAPIFAKENTDNDSNINASDKIYIQKNFEENIKNKYSGSYIDFPTKGIAHIKQTKYINSKPIKINIVELNTKVNPYLKIKPQIAGEKLNSKKTVRKIAQKENSIIAINGGFFKPQTGVPLGALMIDGEILTGPIFNRVGVGIFDNGNNTEFLMDKIGIKIDAYTDDQVIPINNINQPRMLSTYTLLYTSAWGKNSPVAPKNCYNLLVVNRKITKISANPIELSQNSYVIQAPKDIITKLAKKNKEIDIKFQLQDNLKYADHIIGAGPYLVKDSKIYVDYAEQKLSAIQGINPRSAIGYKADGTFIIVTVDGREKSSVGMTLVELAKYMKSIGCEYAMNFDGGSSSALYVKGKIVNTAINSEGIAVSNALVVNETYASDVQISSLN